MPPRQPQRPSRLSPAKRAVILQAAEEAFLRGGYLGVSVDEIAAAARVSKPTVYRHFGSKEDLFVALVTDMTTRAGDGLHDLPAPRTFDELREILAGWAARQLATVLTPRLMQMRRLVIGEAGRFPQLGRALHEAGPRRAITAVADLLREADARGLARVPEPEATAEQFNWLVMGGPVNRAMLLGDDAIDAAPEQRAHAHRCASLLITALSGPS